MRVGQRLFIRRVLHRVPASRDHSGFDGYASNTYKLYISNVANVRANINGVHYANFFVLHSVGTYILEYALYNYR